MVEKSTLVVLDKLVDFINDQASDVEKFSNSEGFSSHYRNGYIMALYEISSLLQEEAEIQKLDSDSYFMKSNDPNKILEYSSDDC